MALRRLRAPLLLALASAALLAAAPGADAAAACPTGLFPDLSAKPGAGPGYAKPWVRVSCTASRLKVRSNGMPSYRFTAKTPNPLEEQEWTWSVPRSPRVAVSTTTIVHRLGTLGFTTTGLPIYGPEEGPVPPDQAYGDPMRNGILDRCFGHTGFMREYHLHAIRYATTCGFTRQRVVGFALDGFPIYAGPACLDEACTRTARMRSGYVLTGDSTSEAWQAHDYRAADDPAVLDRCNGRTQPDGTYGYHVTSGFPYVLGCFRGTPVRQAGAAGGPMPPMGAPPPDRLAGAALLHDGH